VVGVPRAAAVVDVQWLWEEKGTDHYIFFFFFFFLGAQLSLHDKCTDGRLRMEKTGAFECGDLVDIIEGTHVGKTGQVVKVHPKMLSVKVAGTEVVVRVGSRNVRLRSVEEERPRPSRSVVERDRCKLASCTGCEKKRRALLAAKNEVIMMRARMEELIMKLEALAMER
jgi:hypothetical protein